VSSDEPSIVPSIALEAPREETTNNGRTPKTISVEKSVKKLTTPRAITFCMPLLLFLEKEIYLGSLFH
jgi:hypothetical protein